MLTFGFGPDTDRLSALYRYGVLDSASDPTFDEITKGVSAALGGMTVQLVLIDDHRLWTKSIAGASLDENARQGSISAAVIEQCEPLVVGDAMRDPRFRASPAVLDAPRLRAYAGVSLRTPDNHAIGVLHTADTKPRLFRDVHVTLLERAAVRVMEHLELRRTERLDPETGAMASVPFHEQVGLLAELAARHKRDLGLLVIEIDPFRTLLQSFKADLGRLVIDRMGGLGRSNVRRLDSFGRLSETMFAVLLPDTNAAGAASLAHRIVEMLAEGWSFPAPEGVDATPVGIGVATLRGGLDDAEDLIARALAQCHLSRVAPNPDQAPSRNAKVA